MSVDFDSKIQLHLDANNGLEQVTDLIRTRLMENGWRDQVKLLCRKVVIEKSEKTIPSVNELVTVVTPKARRMVPDTVKKELLNEIEAILVKLEKSGYAKSGRK